MKLKIPDLSIQLRLVGDVRRSVYPQLDGSFALPEECGCKKDPYCCPINRHALEARGIVEKLSR